ncbi:unnamed protein product [Rotaria socialis]
MSLTNLPLELIHRIFDYCDILTILSVRVTSKYLYLAANAFDRYDLDNNYASENTLSLITRFIRLQNFVSLNLSSGYVTDDSFTELMSHIDIRQLIRLRSLTLSNLSDVKLKQILSMVNSESLLSLSIQFDVKKYSGVFNILSSAITRLIALQRLHLNTVGYKEMQIAWPTNCSLKYAIIDTCTYNQYRVMIHSLPHLESVSIEDCTLNEYNGKTLLLSAPTLHPSLKSLTMAKSRLPAEYIQRLLSETPNLVNLTLISHKRQFDSLFDGAYWENFIQINLPLLAKFEFFFESCLSKVECDYKGDYHYKEKDENYTHTSLSSLILPFRTPFWLDEKRWFVTCDFLIESADLRICTVPVIVVDKWQCYRCELSPFDDKPRITERLVNEAIGTSTDKVLTTLKFENCGINSIRIGYLADVLRHDKTITNLNLKNNTIGPKGIQYIAEALQQNKTLTTLNLQQNCIGTNGAPYICDILQHNTTLTRLNIGMSGIGVDKMIEIFNALQANTTLKAIDLYHCSIGRYGMDYLTNALQKNTTLTELNLTSNDIKVAAAEHLACLFRKTTTLTFLNIGRNEMEEEGIKYIADALQTNTTLRILQIDWNTIRTTGARHLSDAMRKNTTLTELSVVYNCIGDKGVEHLCDALRHNKTLTSLRLINNGIGPIGAQHFSNVLRDNSTFTAIELGANLIEDKGVGYLADVFRTNKYIDNHQGRL